MDVYTPAGHPAALRSGADREERSAVEGADAAYQAQGCRTTDQRVRRRARRRAHFSLHRAGGEGEATGTPAMAAVDDAGCDSRSVRAIANRRRDDAAGGRRAQPLRGRLAGRHQRHARDDRIQQQGGRLLSDHGRPRADADAGDRRRARGQDPEVRFARLLGSACQLRCKGRNVRRSLVRSEVQEERRRRCARRALVGCRESDCDRRRVPRQDRHSHRGSKAKHAAGAVAVRPDFFAARSELEIRILREDHVVDRASALRAAQGA